MPIAKALAQLQIIKASCTEPLHPDVEAAFAKVESVLEFYDERTISLHVQQTKVRERLQKAATSVKSNNEHVRNLKKKIQEIIEMCK